MKPFTLQIHYNQRGWLDVAQLKFLTSDRVRFEYDIDYAAELNGK